MRDAHASCIAVAAERAEPLTRTEMMLLAIHRDPLIPVVDVAQRYLNYGPDVARRRASKGQLPFPAFQVGSSAKAPFLVRVKDLAEFIDQAAEFGVRAWQHKSVDAADREP